MPAETYKVVVKKPGYKEQEMSVSVPAGERKGHYLLPPFNMGGVLYPHG